VVCSVVVEVVGFAGRTVVSSVVVEEVDVRGSSEAQLDSPPRTEASIQGSRNFFIIWISLIGRYAPRFVVLLVGLSRMALTRVCMVTHVLAIDGNCRGR